MQVKRFAGSVLLVAGLLAGCGGAEAGLDEPSHLESREAPLQSCLKHEYERLFYSEPEMINMVGSETCSCSDSTPWMDGQVTSYSKYTYRYYCIP